MKNIDKISESYEGTYGAKELTERSRERVHWICSQAKGERILDVGCSQGIVSIILAREGKYVKGLDLCQESIDFANESLEKEDEHTRLHAEFICADFITHT